MVQDELVGGLPWDCIVSQVFNTWPFGPELKPTRSVAIPAPGEARMPSCSSFTTTQGRSRLDIRSSESSEAEEPGSNCGDSSRTTQPVTTAMCSLPRDFLLGESLGAMVHLTSR